ncbi:unnamed protein product [Rhizoctonia solani]|uniref:Ubiquitin conjugation factor E4 core domain-containing protein n=1 Tax=Rhizoctonia solani TaxID=456999 RepID=A0A8H2XFW9_9AGAM|nr:unnamed protein product [Rhizoctonia solani]
MYQPQAGPVSLNFPEWEHGTVEKVFNCKLDGEKAEQSGWSITWLCGVKRRLLEEDPGYPQPIQLGVDLADRFLSNRLSLDPCSPTEDPELLTVLLHLPRSETSLGYLVGCWKRIQGIRMQLLRQPLQSADLRRATEILDKLHGLVISYAGLTLQDSSMFPQPEGVTLGPQELVRNLLSLRTVPLHAGTLTLGLGSGDAEAFLGDLAKRFLNNGLDEIFGPIITMVVDALPAEGLGSTGSEWRAVVGALEALVSDTNLAAVLAQFPRLQKWLPEGVAPYQIEFASLLGPLARMSIFDKEWQSLFLIFIAILRTSGDARERVLEYFFTVLNINVKRTGDHVDPTTVASDGFMINLQAVMLRFAEPFLYGKYSKIDHIDTKYFPMVTRANIAEETRINATAEEVNVWKMRLNETGAIPKSFISDIFFLCAGYNHLGIVRTIITHGKITKHIGEIDKWLETAGLAETPSGHQHTPHQGLIERAKANQTRYQRELLACELQLQVPDITQRNLAFINYTMVWMLRMVDPTHQYPSKAMTLPLPERVPDEFNMLPEYFVEDTVEYYIYVMRHCPELLDNSLRIEFLVFALTFLTSTWYVKNPLLKSKLLQGLFYGSIHVGHEHDGLLIALFNSHPMALQHLIPSLMWFYVEVGQTSTNTQFESKRNITFILQLIWNNPNHRNTLLKAAE